MTLTKMVAVLAFWLFFAIVVSIIAHAMGAYSHPLIRVRKKLKTAIKPLTNLKSITHDKERKKTKEFSLLKEATVRFKHSLRLMDVYLYDETEPSARANDGKVLVEAAIESVNKLEEPISEKNTESSDALIDDAIDKAEKARAIFQSIAMEEQKGKKSKA